MCVGVGDCTVIENNIFLSINGYGSNLAAIKFGALQGSVFDLLLLWIYVNDLNQACNMHNFAHDLSVNQLINIKCQSHLKKFTG